MLGFKNLKDGDYKITVENRSGTNSTLFTIKDKTITNKDIMEVKPYIAVKDNVLKISFLKHSLKEVNISLISEEGVIYIKSLGSEFSISAGFYLRKLAKGDYATNISNGDKTYSCNFNK